jgi:hypothetical protein
MVAPTVQNGKTVQRGPVSCSGMLGSTVQLARLALKFLKKGIDDRLRRGWVDPSDRTNEVDECGRVLCASSDEPVLAVRNAQPTLLVGPEPLDRVALACVIEDRAQDVLIIERLDFEHDGGERLVEVNAAIILVHKNQSVCPTYNSAGQCSG